MEIITKCPHCDNDLMITIVKHQMRTLPTPSPILEDVKCPECGGKMASRTGKYGTFWGCLKYPDCRGTRDSMGRSKAEREQSNPATFELNERDNETLPSERYSFNKKQ